MIDIDTDITKKEIDELYNKCDVVFNDILNIKSKLAPEMGSGYLPKYLEELFENINNEYLNLYSWKIDNYAYIEKLENAEKKDENKGIEQDTDLSEYGNSGYSEVVAGTVGSVSVVGSGNISNDYVVQSDNSVEVNLNNDILSSIKSEYSLLSAEDKENRIGSLKVFLKQLPLSNEVINGIDKMSDDEILLLFSNICNGNDNSMFTNRKNISYLYRYLTKLASDNNVSVSELLTDNEYSEIISSEFDNIRESREYLNTTLELDKSEIQKEIYEAYSNEGDAGVQSMIRSVVDNLAEQEGITTLKVMSDASYQDLLVDSLVDANTSLYVIDSINNYNSSNSVNVINDLYEYIDSLEGEVS